MFYLNTTRHLITPADDGVIANLLNRLDTEIGPKAESLAGLRSISWLVSTDRMTVQAFSGWDSAEDLPRAEGSQAHRENGKLIAEIPAAWRSRRATLTTSSSPRGPRGRRFRDRGNAEPRRGRVACADESEVQELFLRNGWGDGLPVVPPTPERVWRVVEATGLDPDTVLGSIPEQGREVTVEHLAVNAVAAGCRVEYTSVLVATVRAMTRPEFGLHSATISGATAPLAIVSGRLRQAGRAQ